MSSAIAGLGSAGHWRLAMHFLERGSLQRLQLDAITFGVPRSVLVSCCCEELCSVDAAWRSDVGIASGWDRYRPASIGIYPFVFPGPGPARHFTDVFQRPLRASAQAAIGACEKSTCWEFALHLFQTTPRSWEMCGWLGSNCGRFQTHPSN